jgi:hypothetical protein
MAKVILLLSAAFTNGNGFVDAGATVPVGTEKHEISEARALDIEKGLRGEISDVEETNEGDDGDGFDAFTIAELKKYATDESIDLGTAKTKPEILAAIRLPRN